MTIQSREYRCTFILVYESNYPNNAVQIDNLQASQIGVPLRSTLRQFGQLINCD